jgi:hypothetical protein
LNISESRVEIVSAQNIGNSDAVNCPITSCTVLEADCLTPLRSSYLINIERTSPFKVYAYQHFCSKYLQQFCYSCTNGEQTIYAPIITVENEDSELGP